MTKDKKREKKDKRKSGKKTAAAIAAGGVCILLICLIFGELQRIEKENQAQTENSMSGDTKESSAENLSDAVQKMPEEKKEDVLIPENLETEINETETNGDSGITATVTISAAGDCTLGTDENFDYSTSLPAKYEQMGNPGYFLENVKDIFFSDDLTIVNLEGTLTDGGSRADKTFAFRGDPSYVNILTEGSVEACNLANNHSKDYGIESYEDTIANVESAGVKTFGYDRTAIYETNGVRIGLAGIYELAEGIGCREQMETAVQQLKDEGADLVIVSFHWGTEKENYPDEIQKELGHAAIDAGADLVLGHHPHVLQGIEKYEGKYIVYSLGNFCFGGNKNPSDKDTMIFQQTFTLTNGAVAEDDQIRVIPCRITSDPSINNYQPTPAREEEAQRILNRISEYSSAF
ncbi:MAG: CapA family protein [Fusicatenibacter sp.]|nr:CapA family protein [Fusicatenibacter sp.]